MVMATDVLDVILLEKKRVPLSLFIYYFYY